jgi:hypothetical protein
MAEVVTEDRVPCAWPHLVCLSCQLIVLRPVPFRSFAIKPSHPFCVVEGPYSLTAGSMSRKVKLRHVSSDMHVPNGAGELLRKVARCSREEIDIVLTKDVVSNADMRKFGSFKCVMQDIIHGDESENMYQETLPSGRMKTNHLSPR